MKKFYFLFLFALIASIGNLYAAEKTVTSTFKDNDLNVGVGEPEWVASIAASTFETSGSKRGVQFGAAKGAFTLTTKVSFSKVKKVSVLLSSNENVNTVSLKVGDTSVGSVVSIEKKNNYSVEWTAESPQNGIVELSFNDKKKSIYIKSISITYEEVAETKCATPTFNLTADATYTDAQDLVITSTTEGAQIEYKIEGDKLTAPITGKQASPATVHLTANDTYMVTATATKEGLDASESADLMFTIAKKMNKPTFNLTEGAVYGEAKVLEITSDKVGAQIEYTVFGGENISITKTEASPVSVTLDQNGEYTVEAFALEMDDYAKSDAAGLNFKIELAAGVPTFSVEEGTYTEAQAITLSPGEGGAQVFYTINGGTEQPFIEPIKLEEDGTYKIAAYTAGTETMAKSATVTKTYVINLPLEEPYILCEDAAWLTDGAKVIFVGESRQILWLV
ncbi:MAG: chitobiase/beta-hexosaminidase C-terminal domain-containing protein [Bacteroidales bacterium]|nr:MAG: chitobiase/beta-hexosaminidase C-terminal domain-containing protein [Bacteroidales bacterium]